ncbi:MAG: ABC transporter permease [Candidatus Methanofastidiosia archaeon]|jgi:simple sugar transport system permease protein
MNPKMVKITGLLEKEGIMDVLISFVAVVCALVVGAVIVYIAGSSPYEAYKALFIGAFGNTYNFAQTLTMTTPLIFTGLTVAFAFRCGLFNIGGEGQLYIGGMTAAIIGVSFTGLPWFIHVPLALGAGAVAGGVWSLVPSVLKAQVGAHEVITTIMMNYIGIYLVSFLSNYTFKAEGWIAQTDIVEKSAQLPRLVSGTQLNAAIFVAIAAVVITYYVLYKTTLGYEIRAVGLNPGAAEYGGISVKKSIIVAMFISGMFAGLGGSGEVLGLYKRFIFGFSPGYGFDGIAVAVLGRNHPVGVVLGALLFGALRNGGMTMKLMTNVPTDLVVVIQGIVILFVAAPEIFRIFRRVKKGGIQNAF